MDRIIRNRLTINRLPALVAALVGGLAASRVMFEWLFPYWSWLGRPVAAVTMALVAVLSAWMLWISGQKRSSFWELTLPWAPLALNLIYLFDPTVDLIRSRFLFLFAVWLMALLVARQRCRQESWPWLGSLFIVTALLPVYLSSMPHHVGQADTFEFQVTAPRLGIAHPTGYPLYLMLGKLFTMLPVGSVAFRLNFGSSVFALAAVSLVFLIGLRLFRRPVPAILAAIGLGLSPTFWSQAIEAEVYSLHALIISAALFLLMKMTVTGSAQLRGKLFLGAAFLTGLGLTNHLTTVFLVPPAILLLLLLDGPHRQPPRRLLGLLLKGAALGIVPLSIYAYLPIRWAAVTGEAMGFRRFIDWVVGGRFQDALQWGAWLHDPTRYQIVGRLFLSNWGWLGLLMSLAGLIYLLIRSRPAAYALLLAWAGFSFYALNYYVPDLAVFLIPAQLIMALFWAAGGAGLLELGRRALSKADREDQGKGSAGEPTSNLMLLLLLFVPLLLLAVSNWASVDQSQDDGLTQWGTGVLNLPLDQNGAILADSEKIAPLYYLQQSEGIRPDLDIMVLPDEASYRAELDWRISAGQTVYLARFLPGLEGIYHLRSAGPLTEVSRSPMTSLPADAVATEIAFDAARLVGYTVEPASAFDPDRLSATLYWQADEPVSELWQVYVRLSEGNRPVDANAVTGQHAANNYYPSLAWRPGEIIADFHQLDRPMSSETRRVQLDVALAPPFSPASDLAWQPVVEIEIPASGIRDLPHPLRAQIGGFLVTGIDYPEQTRPQTDLPVLLAGYSTDPDKLQLTLDNAGGSRGQASANSPGESSAQLTASVMSFRLLETALDSGQYSITAYDADNRGSLCGWMAPRTAGCDLGSVELSGVPLPEGAYNFEDQIALLNIGVSSPILTPGGVLELELLWQSLQSIDEDYTVFIQVLDASDQLVGQIDSWPVQGTRPTSQWSVGEQVADRYRVQLSQEMPPGEYRLLIGWYLLGSLRRLPLIDADGMALDDKVIVPSLQVR